MPIPISEIEAGWVYQTSNKQERLVLGWDAHGRVVYATRGGNVMNPFQGQHTKSSAERFAEKCTVAKVRQVTDLSIYITANNAQNVVVR